VKLSVQSPEACLPPCLSLLTSARSAFISGEGFAVSEKWN
jgi:hypothetical protein